MSASAGGASDPRVLAAQLRRHLEHLATHRNVAYLPRPEVAPRAGNARPPAVSPQSASMPTPADARRALAAQAASWSPATKLEYLRRRNVGDCQRCPLARTRHNIVFGVGNPEADVVFVGEAPGAEEDRKGEPFVGAAGRRLDQWLAMAGLSREEVYIANVLKCRPPGNRDPAPGEVDTCSPFLAAQLRAIEPRVVVALGRHAAMALSRREDASLRAMRRGQLFYTDPKTNTKIPLIATYHPAFVLRKDGQPEECARYTELVLEDLRRARSIASG